MSGAPSGSSAAFSSFTMLASEASGTVPGAHFTSKARTASMHWPNVRARTATPVLTLTTSVTPGIASTFFLFRIFTGVPFSVGARQIIVGFAPLTRRSRVNVFWPVTAARASVRLCGVPITVKSDVALRSTATCSVTAVAAFAARSPKEMPAPPGAVMTPSLLVSRDAVSPSSSAATCSSRWCAIAAATRTGVNVEIVVLEPPVSWLNTSSGRASARVTCTFDTGSPSSSAISIAVEVTMPWPTSARGSAKLAVPSGLITTVIRSAVGRVASVSMSLRSYSSGGCGPEGTTACAGDADAVPRPSSAAAARVGAASR
jgi:hypothetical protein